MIKQLSIALGLALPFAVQAQAVHGATVDPGGQPVFGVVVLLEDSTSHVAARSLSTERGDFRLTAPHPGTYRLRTLRIGFRPVVSDQIVLTAGADVTQRIVLTGVALGLDTVRVSNQSVCRAFTDSGAATYAVWEQVRTALTAAELSASARTIMATTVAYERTHDPYSGSGDGRILRQQAKVATAPVTRPWRALSPDSLRRFGYVITDRNDLVTYYAPGLDMLLSGVFVEDHCFKLVTDSKRRSQLGIAFEPTPDRRKTKLADIRGTVWVDRASSQLSELEFRYENLPAEQDRAGGGLSFVSMRDGTWAISRWVIKMPVVEQIMRPGHGAELRLKELQTSGGALALTTRGADTLWSEPPMSVRGQLLDSTSSSPLPRGRVALAGTAHAGEADDRGRFVIAGVLPGQYTAEVRTPSLDSMNTIHRASLTIVDSTTPVELRVPSGKQIAATICGSGYSGGAIVLGTLRLRDDSSARSPLRGAKVAALWSTDANDATKLRRLETPVTTSGDFKLCDVPSNRTITLSAKSDSGETAEPSSVRIPVSARLANARLVLERESDLLARGATFAGVVVSDSTHQPIVAADVSFPELSKTVLTDEKGEFRIRGIPAGEQHLSVRRLGYGAADTRVTFTGHETLERRVVLGKVISLDPVLIVDKFTQRRLQEFEDNRRVGLGHFMTRDVLEKYTGMRLTSVLSQFPRFGVVAGHAHSWAYAKRPPPPCPPPTSPNPDCLKRNGYYFPTPEEQFDGMAVACYALVFVDGQLWNPKLDPTEPVSLDEFFPETVEAIEFYDGPAQTPMMYMRKGAECGVVAIWRRRK